MSVTLDEIIEEFSDLEPQDQSQYLLELGFDLPEFPANQKIEDNLVHGCQSQVWLIAHAAKQGPGQDARLTIQADSDSQIVRGLISILLASYSGRTARQILDFDIQQVFERLHIQQHISPQRRNGLRGMVERIQKLAAAHVDPISVAPAQVQRIAKGETTVKAPDIENSKQTPFDAERIRTQFPVLMQTLPGGLRPIYLDSGASAQKPIVVIEKEREVEEQYFANAYRGRYSFGARVDDELEAARSLIADFINAPSSERVAFTPGTTAGLNMVAFGWGRRHVQAGDEILITMMEHHANFVPWQQLALERRATLRFMPLTEDGQIDMNQLDQVLTTRTKIVAVCGMSNVLGTVNPIGDLTRRAHAVGARIVVDAAQSAPHAATDVQELDVDFLVFSGHKMYGPTGVGVLYGSEQALAETDPILFGGHMIDRVFADHSTWAAPPAKFEAGTLPIVQAIGLGVAVKWMQQTGIHNIHNHEQSLLQTAMAQLEQIEGLKIFGPDLKHRGGIISFRIDGVHPEDLAAILDQHAVFTRHGHHCTMPLHDYLGVSATTRVSFAAYNTLQDVDQLLSALRAAIQRLRR